MIGHLKDRAAALAALGWTGDDAEWLAFVCLHSGAFLRSQYLTFIGSLHPSAASRFIDRCASIAVEEAWNGTPLKLCRITARPVYRALGAEHIRHRRRPSATGLLLRRLLAFDFVVDHADRPWLPTEDEKVTMLSAVGVPEQALPRRVYQAENGGGGQTRYFVHKLPVAVGKTASLFVYVQAGADSEAALRTWGEAHAALWAALRANGRGGVGGRGWQRARSVDGRGQGVVGVGGGGRRTWGSGWRGGGGARGSHCSDRRGRRETVSEVRRAGCGVRAVRHVETRAARPGRRRGMAHAARRALRPGRCGGPHGW